MPEEIEIEDVTLRPTASILAERWGCTKGYLSKIKKSHCFDASSFKTTEEADEWLKEKQPKLNYN